MTAATEPKQAPATEPPPDMWTRFARVLCNLDPIVKDQTADIKENFSYKYADINQVLAKLKPVLFAHDIAIAQPIEVVDGNMTVTTVLICTRTGERLGFHGPGFPIKGDPQQSGSALTYMRRYAITSLFSLEAHDDDGGTAHRAVATPTARTPAETEIRLTIGNWEKGDRQQFAMEFKTYFGTTLTAMPESSHGDALTFLKRYLAEAMVVSEPADERVES
jgi:hypothetical protein